jgi:hypothetical protein
VTRSRVRQHPSDSSCDLRVPVVVCQGLGARKLELWADVEVEGCGGRRPPPERSVCSTGAIWATIHRVSGGLHRGLQGLGSAPGAPGEVLGMTSPARGPGAATLRDRHGPGAARSVWTRPDPERPGTRLGRAGAARRVRAAAPAQTPLALQTSLGKVERETGFEPWIPCVGPDPGGDVDCDARVADGPEPP